MGFNTNSNVAANNAAKDEDEVVAYGLGWNDEISDDGGYALFEEGDYTFKVLKLEKGSQPPTARIPNGCNRATLTLQLINSETDQTTSIKENLLLLSTMEWKLCAFFRSIGLKKHGEKLVMDWSKVVGACGKAHIGFRDYVKQDGSVVKVNEVKKFLDPDEQPW